MLFQIFKKNYCNRRLEIRNFKEGVKLSKQLKQLINNTENLYNTHVCIG